MEFALSNPQDVSQERSKFPVGTAVRVKAGTMDPDFLDIPLGGWAGTVQQIDAPTYLVKWNQDTIDQMNPVYRKRCERDDLEMETMWLEENDLELDAGEPTKIEQPTALVTRTLSQENQDDRIRAIFGLTSDDPLPMATEDNLQRYHRYLATHLSLPFQAKYMVEEGPLMERECPVTITELLDPDESDATEGLLCKGVEDGEAIELPLAEVEGCNNPQNDQLIGDYAYWFTNSEDDESDEVDFFPGIPFNPPSFFPKKRISFTVALILVLVSGAVIGMVLGSLLAAIELARILAVSGAVVLGLCGLIAGSRFGSILGRLNWVKKASFWGSVLGAMGGVMVGGLLGAMFVAVVGLFTGGIVGAIVAELALGGRKRALAIFFGAMVGVVVQAFLVDQEQALVGAIYGGAIGAVAAVLTVIGLKTVVALNRRR